MEENPLFTIDYLKLLEWVANYYCTDLITVINAAIPLKLIEKASKTEQLAEFVTFEGATKRQIEVLEKLKARGKCNLIFFEKEAKPTRTTIKKLEDLGCLKLTSEELYFRRNKTKYTRGLRKKSPKLRRIPCFYTVSPQAARLKFILNSLTIA